MFQLIYDTLSKHAFTPDFALMLFCPVSADHSSSPRPRAVSGGYHYDRTPRRRRRHTPAVDDHRRRVDAVGPVAVTLHLARLRVERHHGDRVGALLPHHRPEVRRRRRHRALARDVRESVVAHQVAHVARVDVVVGRVARQADARLVI